MAKKKHKYKIPDITDYETLEYNPFVFDQDTFNKLNNTHYDVSMIDHRKRMDEWKKREDERAALAKRLGVTPEQMPKLTPAHEILEQLKMLS